MLYWASLMLVHLQLFLRFFHGGRALGVFILCYQKGSFGRVCIIAFLFSETVRVGVLERRPFRQTQKLSSFRKVGTAFLTSAPASCYLFCVWKKITKPLDSKSTVSIGFLWLGDHHVVASDGLDWRLDWTRSSIPLANRRHAVSISDYKPYCQVLLYRSRFSSPGRAPD